MNFFVDFCFWWFLAFKKENHNFIFSLRFPLNLVDWSHWHHSFKNLLLFVFPSLQLSSTSFSVVTPN